MSDPFERIYDASGEYARTHNNELPTRVYLGREETREVCVHSHAQRYLDPDLSRVCGLRLFQVRSESHLHVSHDPADLPT